MRADKSNPVDPVCVPDDDGLIPTAAPVDLPEPPSAQPEPVSEAVWIDEESDTATIVSLPEPPKGHDEITISTVEFEPCIYKDENGLSVHALSGVVTTTDGQQGSIQTGHVYEIRGTGVPAVVAFQQGAVPKNGVNGVTNEALLQILIHRTEIINDQFPCDENFHALSYMRAALNCFNDRTARRKSAGIEGTYAEQQTHKPEMAIGTHVYDQYHNAGQIVAGYANFAEYAADPQNFVSMTPDYWLAAQEHKHTEQELGETWYSVKLMAGGMAASPASRLYSAEASATEYLGDHPIDVKYVSKKLFDDMKRQLACVKDFSALSQKSFDAKQAQMQRIIDTQSIELKRWQGACLGLTDVIGDMRIENQGLGQEVLGLEEDLLSANSKIEQTSVPEQHFLKKGGGVVGSPNDVSNTEPVTLASLQQKHTLSVGEYVHDAYGRKFLIISEYKKFEDIPEQARVTGGLDLIHSNIDSSEKWFAIERDDGLIKYSYESHLRNVKISDYLHNQKIEGDVVSKDLFLELRADFLEICELYKLAARPKTKHVLGSLHDGKGFSGFSTKDSGC